MRDNLKRFGRGLLNLLAFLVFVVAVQLAFRGHPGPLATVIMPLLALAIYCAGVRWIEGRQPVELTDPRGATEFPVGIGIGIVLFATVMLLLLAIGDYHPEGWGTARPLVTGALFAVLTAVLEEIIFRGFLYRLTSALFGTWGALLLTSVLFGAGHIANPSATVGSSVAIALEAGVLLGAAYALTQRLWLPIGLHAGWNFAEGSIFGMTVSGFSGGKSSLVRGTLHGPNLLTGGAFGPEASILAVAVCLTVAVVLLWRTVRLRRVERPFWSSVPAAKLPASAAH